jgi:succinyl-diaminopimelate desuccinylase
LIRDIIDLTKALIRFPTTAQHPGQIAACMDFVGDKLAGMGAAYRRFDHDGVPSILVTGAGAKAPVLLLSHLDVVDASAVLFEPVEKEGKLFGRGSIDDKYAVALSLVMLQTHLERLRAGGRGQACLPFGLLITGDEEIGGRCGAQRVLDEVDTDFGIALDGGNLHNVVVKEKGILRLKLVATGRSAHGARPWLGDNAVDNLLADYLKLKPLFDTDAPDHWHATLNLSRMAAGKADNQVPDRAEALFDIRYTENDDVDLLVERMRTVIAGSLRVVGVEPLFKGGDSPYLDLLLRLNPDLKPGVEHGASDARFLTQRGIAGIVWGADGQNSQHAENEHVVIDSMAELFTKLDRFLLEAAEMTV